ncbi:Glutaconyl-CoA decarboxylase subunit beta [Sedimentisphaera cyanobacteriorum]|uniref:Glutaconyl-CoA decarboxylase subunit beta n=2 Tax=Sedimentisphaera cyanobacteriorum TaxID=1940790 RepID=A0A1Q2HSG2_9BACT|nr:sodium ion-translocating decarboxylase subunit beta [Sedimentisphaera cyanobacteriorum]AQQ10388.1 Glutaconyl-CoA decarboxylase subunit beta [Sedimentisphaera cyanobacteriorum]
MNKLLNENKKTGLRAFIFVIAAGLITAGFAFADNALKQAEDTAQKEAGNVLKAAEAENEPAEPAENQQSGGFGEKLGLLWKQTGIYRFFNPATDEEKAQERAAAMERKSQAESAEQQGSFCGEGLGRFLMIIVGLVLIFLAINKGFEPLLLLPIGFGCILANIPVAGIAEPGLPGNPDGFLYIIYSMGVKNGLFPLIIFMGVGAMTDFGPLIANPKMAILGAAAQFGIFSTLLMALAITPLGFSLSDASAIGIIGGADGPTAIFLSGRLAPDLLGAIAVAAYSYMALVPVIQPPIMRALTSKSERMIEMKQLRHVTKLEKIVFPILVLALCVLLLPSACPLIGALMFGNLCKESGVVNRLSDTMQNSLINIVTIMLGLAVGSKLAYDKFLTIQTVGILVLGVVAFCIGTASGLLIARLYNKFAKDKINPLIGAAGVSAVPMAARVANKVGVEENPHNFLLMHAMGPNVSGVIGSAVAAGVLLALCGG